MLLNISLSQRKGLRFGFTLIELLVVISIIALLLSILIPSLSKARDKAKKVVCGSNMKNVMLSTYIYAAEHDDKLPGNEGPADIPDWNVNPATTWAKSLYPYLEEQWHVYACPAAEKYRHPAWGDINTQLTQARPGTSFMITSYCNFRKQSKIRTPGRLVMFWEKRQQSIWSSRYPNGKSPLGDWGLLSAPTIHNSKPDYLFADCHIESGNEEEMWKPEYFWPEYAR